MRGKLGKVSVLFLALVLALGGIGAAFASWTDTITFGGTVSTGELEWEFSGIPTQGDTGNDPNVFFTLESLNWVTTDKDVANTTVEIVAPDTLLVTVNNAYPYYGNHIGFVVHGLGTIPLRIWKVNFWVGVDLIETLYANDYVDLNLDGLGGDDLEIWWGDNFGKQAHHSDRYNMSFEFLVLQPAPQGQSLSFTIELVGIQWNEYVQGPL